jgi:redox-sensitive bicupin YhaK (pirin superfamily)
VQLPGATARVLIGSAFGVTSPVPAPSPTVYIDFIAQADARIALDVNYPELALYSVDHDLAIGTQTLPAHTISVLALSSTPVTVTAPQGARFVLIGGAVLESRRLMWWNFVSSSKERIEQAKADWAAQRMGQIPGETEWIPLPLKYKTQYSCAFPRIFA